METGKQFTRALGDTLDAVISVDANGSIVEFNEQAERILGYKAEEILGKSVKQLYGENEEAQRVKYALLNNPDYYLRDFETALINAKDEVIPIFLSAIVKLDHEEQYAGSVGFFRGRRDLVQEARQVISLLYEPGDSNFQTRVVKTLADKMSAEMCLLLRYNHHTDTLKVEDVYGVPRKVLSGEGYKVEGALGRALEENEISRFTRSHDKQEELAAEEFVSLGRYSEFDAIYNCLVVPLAHRVQSQEQPFGVLLLLNRYWKDKKSIDEAGFSRIDAIWLSMVANEIGTLIQHDYYLKSLSTLLDIGAGLLGEHDILQKITDSLVNVLGYRTAYIRLLKPDRSLPIWVSSGSKTDLLIPDMSDATQAEKSFYTTPSGKGIVGKAVRENKIQAVEDAFKEPNIYFKENIRKAGWHGMLAVPINLQNQVVGVLVCYTGRPHVFSENDKRLVTTLANLAALALNNSLLSEEREQEQELLHSIIRLAIEGQDTKATWRTVLHEVMDLTGAERGSIHLVDHNNSTLLPLVQRGFSKDYSSTIHYIYPQLPTSIVGWVAKYKQPVLIRNVKEEPKWLKIYFSGANDTLAELTAPLFAKDPENPIGIINLESPRPNAFTVEHRRLLESLAIFPNIITTNETLNNAIKKKRRQQEAMKSAIRVITGTRLAGLERTEVLQAIVEQAVNVTEANIGAIHLKDGNELVLEVAYPPERLDILQQKIGRLPLYGRGNGRGIIVRAVENSRAQLVRDVRQDIDYIAIDSSTRSELAVFLGDGEQILGTLNVEHSEVGKFDEEDKDTLIALSNLAVVAMEFVEQAKVLAREQDRIRKYRSLARFKSLQSILEHTIPGLISYVQGQLDSISRQLARGQMVDLESKINEAREKTKELINEVNSYTRWQPTKTERVDLNEIFSSLIPVWQLQYRNMDITLRARLYERVTIEADRREFEHVMEEIVRNAAKRLAKPTETASKTKLDIHLNKTSSGIQIIFLDNGPGIDLETIKIIGRQPIEGEQGGWGALAVAVYIEDEFNGEIRWNNLLPRGTEVIITLPYS